MKRLIVSGAVLFGCFSSLVAGCGSRSSDDEFLPPAGTFAGASTQGNAGDTSSSGNSSVAGDASSGGASAAGTTSSGGAIGHAGTNGGAGTIGLAGAAAGGASSGGASTSGGTAGLGASGSVGIAGSGVGGVIGVAGSGAAGAAGAGGGNSASCPVNTPNNNSACMTPALQCNYTGRSCLCQQAGNNLAWRCAGSGNACPAAEPVAGDACTGNLRCPYPDGDQCNCAGGAWGCFTAGCPASKPTPSQSCGSVFGQCKYGVGPGSACVCVAGGWFCN